jgi:hypothetical protein
MAFHVRGPALLKAASCAAITIRQMGAERAYAVLACLRISVPHIAFALALLFALRGVAPAFFFAGLFNLRALRNALFSRCRFRRHEIIIRDVSRAASGQKQDSKKGHECLHGP